MNKNFYSQPKNILHFQAQTENEVRTNLEQKISASMIGIKEKILTKGRTNR